MIERKLLPTLEYLLSIFEYRNGKLYWKVKFTKRINLGDRAGNDKSDGYRYITIDKKTYKEHRIIWKLLTGNEPNIIDHINKITNDNRIENLRSVSISINGKNMESNKLPTSGYKNIHYVPKKLSSFIVKLKDLNSKSYSKSFKTLKEAIQHRDEKYIEFGYINKL